ncbi:hypothetical protein [Paraburkholderia fungorum]|uniref:hypothetical protein n=1 Tax=Paraburkholderia fungorum TaxID=134537 RepID=UPI0038BDF1B5
MATDPKTPRERIAASIQLRDAVAQYVQMQTWTPVMAALLMCGVHPPAGATAIPDGGVGLDGVVFRSGGNDRFHDAMLVLKVWRQFTEDHQREPDDCLPPDMFLKWCEVQIVEEGLRIDPCWVNFQLDVLYGPVAQSNDIIPIEVAVHSDAVSTLLENRSKSELAPSETCAGRECVKPRKIQTSEVIRLFEGLPHQNKTGWHRAFDTVPEGLKDARDEPEKSGVEALWDPVLVAEWMWGQRSMSLTRLDTVFKQESLEPWRPFWEEKRKWIERSQKRRSKRYSVSR